MKITYHEDFGPQKQSNKEWILKDSLKIIKEKKEKTTKVNDSHTCAEKAMNQEVFEECEKEHQGGRSSQEEQRKREFYITTTKLSEKFSQPDGLVNNKYGEQIHSEEGQEQRWLQPFEEPPDIKLNGQL